MKSSVASIILAVLALLPSTIVATATPEFAQMVVFNENILDKPNKACSATRWKQVLDTIVAAGTATAAPTPGGVRRQLAGKGSGSSSGSGSSHQRERHLACTNCGAYCGYVGTGCPGGKSGRRRKSRRDLQASVGNYDACVAKIPAIEAALVALIPIMQDVEPSCANLIASQRDIACREVNTQCGVDNVSLETDTLQVAHVPLRGTAFCVGEPVAFTAETEFVEGSVTFLVQGKSADGMLSKMTDTEHPFAYHGNTADLPLAADDYTLTITTGYDPTHPKTLSFKVIDC